MALQDPYLADTWPLLTKSHRQRCAARATHPGWAQPITLDVERLTVSWDEARAPRVQATLSCKVPQDQATLDALDPRTGVRIQIDAGYVRPGGVQDVHTIADLGLRYRRVSRPDNTLELGAASDEALVIDNHWAGSTLTASSVPDAMTTVLRQVFPAAAPTVSAAAGSAVTLDPVTDRWTALDDLADRIDADIYDNGLRQWFITARPAVTGTAAAALKVGANGTVLDSDTGLTREGSATGWANRVVLEYDWRDQNGQDQRILATADVTSGPFAVTGPGMVKVFHETRDVPTTQAEANTVARNLLRRRLSAGRSMTLSSVAAYWLRPGMTVTVQLPLGPQERHLVSAVEFDPIEGRMTVVTRLPDNSSTISTGA